MLRPKSNLNQDLIFLRFLLIVLIASFLFIKYCTGTTRADVHKVNSATIAAVNMSAKPSSSLDYHRRMLP